MKVSLILLWLVVIVAAAEGRVQGRASIFYMEEQPLEHTLEFQVGAGGDASISVTSLKPDCPENWEKRCWAKSARRVRLTDKEYNKLLSLLADADLNSIPREVAAMPGGARMHLVVNGVQKIDVLASLARAGQNAGFRAVRAAILQIVSPIE